MIYILLNKKREATELLIEQGYDGVIVDDMGEGFTEYIVLKNTNIKSATDNIGTFDESNPDIRYSEGDVLELLAENDNNLDKEFKNDIITDKEQMFGDDRKQLDNVVMQAQLKAKRKLGYLPKNGYTYTNDYFVMFENDDVGEYKMDFAIWVDGNEDFINYLQEVWDNGRTERGTKNIVSIITDFRSGKGSSNWNNAFAEKRGTSGGDDRLSGQTQRGGPERHFGGSEPNSSRGDKIKYSEGDFSELLDKAQSELEDLISEYGIIEQGENPARDVRLPKQTGKGEHTRRYARTAAESDVMSDDMAGSIMEAVADGVFSYKQITDKGAWNSAKRDVKNLGADGAMRKWNAIVESGKGASKEDIALGEYLLQGAAEAGDAEMVVRLTAEIAAMGKVEDIGMDIVKNTYIRKDVSTQL